MTSVKKPPADFGPIQAQREIGMAGWQFEAALRRGLIPRADRGGRWSAEVVAAATARCAEIIAALPEGRPVGAHKAAERIGERLDGVKVWAAEVDILAERGFLVAIDEYKGNPCYDLHDLDSVADEHAELITQLVAERQTWLQTSISDNDARDRLRWSREEFARVLRERGITAGRFKRFALADIEALAEDAELDVEVRGRRLLGPDQAAEYLQIRRRDFDYLTSAGFVSPAKHVDSQVGRNRYVTVALYTAASLDDVLDIPGIDWEALRSVRPGDPSPLREFTALPIARATLVRGLAADLSHTHATAVTARYDYRADAWQLHWVTGGAQPLREDTVRAEIRARAELKPYQREITLHPTDSDQENTD
ncbi:hypothetical protein [Nocardia sp. IFM 10818]